MEKFISDLNKHYRLDNFRIKDDAVIFEISSMLEMVECPYYGQASSKIHSYYQREIQDLPM